MSKSSVHSIKVAYYSECAQKRRADSFDTIAKLHPRKRGHPFLLGTHVEEQVQTNLKKIRDQGGVVCLSWLLRAVYSYVAGGPVAPPELFSFTLYMR